MTSPPASLTAARPASRGRRRWGTSNSWNGCGSRSGSASSKGSPPTFDPLPFCVLSGRMSPLMQVFGNTGGIAQTNAFLVADEQAGEAVLFDAPNDTVAPLLDEVAQRGWTL